MTDEAVKAAWTIAEVLKWATDDFRTREIESPRLDAEVLLAHALGTTRMSLIIDAKRPLVGDELSRFRGLVKRRRVREPVAYLLGEREFYGRNFRIDKRVLVPRPDTEILVDRALSRTAHVSLAMRALDICTGSGCVGITLARERVTARVLGADLSEDALKVARDNMIRLGATNIGFYRSDLFSAFERKKPKFDLITANPPYIPSGDIDGLMADVKSFEPRLALDGGPDGLVLMRKIVEQAPTFLDEGGVLAVELGAGEAQDVAALFRARGFVDVAITRDYGKIERVVDGIWPRDTP